jgi:hypothetical protein
MKTLDPFAAITFPFFPSSPISAYPINHDPHTLSCFTTKHVGSTRHPGPVMLQIFRGTLRLTQSLFA